MHPIQHHTNNDVLRAPPGVPIEECRPLFITRLVYEPQGIPAVVSYWQPTAEQLRLLNEGQPVFLSIWGHTHPPIVIGVDGDGRL